MDTLEVTRALRHAGDSDLVAVVLEGVPGVLRVTLRGTDRVQISYDIFKTDYRNLCSAVEDAGVPLPGGTLARWRRSWYAFQDANLRDNAGYRPPCCSKPPPGAGRR